LSDKFSRLAIDIRNLHYDQKLKHNQQSAKNPKSSIN